MTDQQLQVSCVHGLLYNIVLVYRSRWLYTQGIRKYGRTHWKSEVILPTLRTSHASVWHSLAKKREVWITDYKEAHANGIPCENWNRLIIAWVWDKDKVEHKNWNGKGNVTTRNGNELCSHENLFLLTIVMLQNPAFGIMTFDILVMYLRLNYWRFQWWWWWW